MINRIDRDLEKIIELSQNSKQKIDLVKSKALSVAQAVKVYQTEINDKNCLSAFKDLLVNLQTFIKYLDLLSEENDTIYKECKKIWDIENGGLSK